MRDTVLRLLRETPVRLAEVTSGVAPVRLRTPPGEGEWSANDVLAHLRSCADVWGDAIARVLREDTPTIRASSPRAAIHRKDYSDLEFAPSLRAFTAQREEFLAVLEGLPPEGWSRSATVTGAGRPYPRTVLDFGERLARHERGHVKQIERLMCNGSSTPRTP